MSHRKTATVELGASASLPLKVPDERKKIITPPTFNSSPLKMVVGILLSYWDGLFLKDYVSFREDT